MSTLVFVHGWSVTSTATYGQMPQRLQQQAATLGLPLTLRGERGGSAEDAMVFAEELAAVAPCEVRMLDERLTTRQAQRGLSAAGRTHRRSRAVIDQAAAVILLNHALDTERATGTPAGRRVTVGESPAGPGAATDPTDEGRSSP